MKDVKKRRKKKRRKNLSSVEGTRTFVVHVLDQ